MRGWLVLSWAFLMQLCMGATYAWSMFVQPIREAIGIGQGTAQLPISLFYFVFPFAALATGNWLHRLGPRRASLIGCGLFAGGFLLSGLGTTGFHWVVAGVGLLAGTGCGIFYLVPVSVAVAWMPERKGLATAIAVAGVGLSGAIWAPLAYWLLETHGLSPFGVLAALGGLFVVILVPGTLWMTYPPGFEREQTTPPPLREFLRDRTFWWLFAAFAAALAAGFTVSGHMRELTEAGTLAGGVRAVAAFCIASATGRLVWGGVSDRCPPGWMIRLNLLGQALAFGAAGWLPAGLWFALVTGFNHGGANVLYAACTARLWGKVRLTVVFGWLFAANALAALAPWLAGEWYDKMNNFKVPLFGLAGALALLALVIRLRPAELDCDDCERKVD